MTKKINVLIATIAVFLTATGLHVTLRAQAMSTGDGVYTEAQAKRGADVYAKQCASCHGEDMSGVPDLFPPLAGSGFLAAWEGKSVADVFEKVMNTMPALDPGSLTLQQTADIVAHMLSTGKYPAGAAELAAEVAPLKQIKIDPLKK